jgi:uncharacterized membrane protein
MWRRRAGDPGGDVDSGRGRVRRSWRSCWSASLGRAVRAWLTRPLSGQALPLVAAALPLLVTVVGLALDGGVVFAARRELQNVADAAARAGATEVDPAAFRATGGVVALDGPRALATASGYVADYNALHRPDQQVSLDAVTLLGRDRVVVAVNRDASTAFLRIVKISTVPIRAEASATVRAGGD